MLTSKEIFEQELSVYIYVGDNKEGVPQFRKVRYPEAVDAAKGIVQLWVEDIMLDDAEELMAPVALDPKNPPTLPPVLPVEAQLKQYTGHVVVFDLQGKKVDETPVEDKG
jgi:hypothetical protein